MVTGKGGQPLVDALRRQASIDVTIPCLLDCINDTIHFLRMCVYVSVCVRERVNQDKKNTNLENNNSQGAWSLAIDLSCTYN